MMLLAMAPGTSFGASGSQVETVQPPSPMADALAAQMRVLGADPKNVPALIEAGELALKLGDPTAAARFFARAERLDPRNARLKAGEASALVHLERPGEALRLFDEAQALGADPVSFAAEQALALDLVGQQTRAQRAYRVALKAGHDDETERRYALSLGISGQREAALEQIDAQLRHSDRAAWRVRAFVLAMTGDVAGANRIAAATLPPSMASGLQPFFDRLGGLGPVDRAFAVHFGEVAPTAERLADARLAPMFTPLAPERAAVAPATAPVVAAAPKRPPDRRRRRAEPPSVAVALVAASGGKNVPPAALVAPRDRAPVAGDAAPRSGSAPMPAKTGAAVEAPLMPVAGSTGATAALAPAPDPRAAPQPPALAEAGRAPASPLPAPGGGISAPRPAGALVAEPPAVVTRGALPPPSGARSGDTEKQEAVALPFGARSPGVETGPANAPATAASAVAQTAAVAAAPLLPMPGVAAGEPTEAPEQRATSPAAQVAGSLADAAPAPISAAPSAPLPPRSQPSAVASEESILARIIAGIGVPASELGVGPPRSTPPPAERDPPLKAPAKLAPALAPVETRPTAADRDDAATRVATGKAATGKAATGKAGAEKAATGKLAVAKPATDNKLADRKPADKKAADKKAGDAKSATDKKLADKAAADKNAADKKAAEKKAADKLAATARAADEKATKASPSRVWVQVSGGANARDLPKAWAAVRDKAPALKGKSAWSTPLRFTNRVLTGPFASQAEAQNFVNLLAKSGVSAFVFTSDKGQPVARVPAP